MSIRDYSRRLFCNTVLNGAVYDATQAACIALRIIVFDAFHVYPVSSFCLLPSVYLTGCFVHVSVRAYN